MRWWLGRGLQITGLVVTGTGCVLPFFRDASEAQFMLLGFGGFAIFWIGCQVLGARQA